MDPAAPTVFDRPLVRRRLERALAGSFGGFLLDRAADDLEERLGAVTRAFPIAADIGTATDAALSVLARSGEVETIVRLAGATRREPGAHSLVAVADEERLPLAAESVDLAVSLLALQSVNDLPGALLQVRRALRPDGLLLACLFGGDTLTELRQSFAAAESELEGGVSPRVAPFADVRSAGALLQRAGFALPVVDLERVTVRYGSVFGLTADLRAMGLTNALAERRRTPLRRATLMRMAAVYAERFADGDGRVRATFDIVWLSGWAPHESQQKALRPGSARSRLADALGATERPLPGGGSREDG